MFGALHGGLYGALFGDAAAAAPTVAPAIEAIEGVDHVAAALARLPQQYRNDPPTNVQKFLAALVGAFQAREAAQQQLLLERTVNTATGVTLTAVGELVGRPRNGVTDDEAYRRLVRAQIAVNSSDGLVEQLLTISQLVVFDSTARYLVVNLGGGAVEVRIERIAVPAGVADLAAQMIRAAVDGGVRSVLISTTSADDEAFTLGYAPDEVDGAHGGGDTTILIIGDGSAIWPETGRIYFGAASTVTYAYRKVVGGLSIFPALASALLGGEAVTVVVGGKGFGSAAESGQPCLVPYTSPGTTGGQLSNAR